MASTVSCERAQVSSGTENAAGLMTHCHKHPFVTASRTCGVSEARHAGTRASAHLELFRLEHERQVKELARRVDELQKIRLVGDRVID